MMVADAEEDTLNCEIEEAEHYRIPSSPWKERDSPKIELLIGSDIYGSLLSGRVKQLENGLTAIEIHLGWTICGPSPKKDEQTDYSSLVVISMHSRNMSVDYLWDLETIGIKVPRENLTKLEEDKIVHQHFLNTLHHLEDGRFCVGLPWLGNQEGIPSNRHIAERRLFNTTHKLRVKCIFSECDRVFQEWLAEGVIEKVSTEDLNRKCHYLPHHRVVKADSNTTKIRPVFDASCKDKGNLSLNDCLASCPIVIEQIPAILLKFREKAIGVIADIRKAFLQIEVKEEDRDYLRFLWWKNNHQIQVFRHKRVVFGVTCSPYLLGAVILHHLKGISSEFGALHQKLIECLYIDNYVTSVDAEAELVNLVEKSTEIFAKAKMYLRMWQFGPIHRVKEVYSRLPPSVDIVRSEEASVLGMKWNLLEGTLNVTPKFGVIINSLSKRDLLSHTQQIFDPIGFLAPVLLPAKLFIQQAWTVKTDWDEPLPSTIQENCMKWYSELDTLADIKIPRRGASTLQTFLQEVVVYYSLNVPDDCQNKCVDPEVHTKYTKIVPIRVRHATAFGILGVDLAGPFYLKNKTKAWIVLFTCAVFRAIHLELVTSLSTEAFIQALRRFIARRGRPTVIYSYNGTNFVGVNNALKALNWKKIVLDQNIHKISWKFIPPTAAWWGVYYKEMPTILCDVEATINLRPLKYINEDFDSLIPLSTSMFLHDSKYVGVPDLDKLDSKKFQGRYRHCQRLREALRSRIQSEYLGQLVQKANERTPKLSVGDVVIVKVEDKRRLHWPMARIVELLTGRDGHSRVAKVRTKLGTLIRPVQKLYPLEVSSGDPILRSKGDITIEEEHSEAKRTRCGRVLALGPHHAPIGWRTPLGWTVGGNFDDLMETQGCVNYTVSEPVNDNDLQELIKSSFSTENFVVIPRTRWQGMNQVEGRAEFNEYQEKEYIRKLDSIEVIKGSERTWYIPQFGITNPNKPGKLRLVFDAAARSNGVSLYEDLSKGPDLIRPLTSVLWNFRVHNIARNGNITTTLFGSKARVAPLKKLTIPKLDLQGCVLGTRFAVLLRSELRLLKVDREVFWSYSKTVLAWIRSEAGRYKEFVANSRRNPGSDKRNRMEMGSNKRESC
ncbi:hypothetical protein LAZ67_19001901 [Cordylochernes scorpioides]|uniref:Integrase catalytic domain-containing protein n=1 Tax=Cordylochernes scorpioides TaxID=51811 RepID=A0ABY6LI24_9ARAC|nr:hypothetical protein LAZ67_19001901 [Cordylochernes scorpioides]